MRIRREETEKQLRPLWIANWAISRLNGGTGDISYEDFLKEIFEQPTPKPSNRSPEDIMKEFMPFVEAERAKGGD